MSKKAKLITWASISAVSAAVLVVATILTTGKLYSLLNIVMPGGGERPRFAEGVESYYLSQYQTKDQTLAAGQDFNVRLGDEGFTLLKNKNNAALPLKTAKSDKDAASKAPRISVFGKNSVNLAYGGSGSSGVSSDSRVDLYKALETSGYEINPTLKSFYEDTKASGAKRDSSGSDLDSGDTVILSTAETPWDSYTSVVKDSFASDYKDAAVVVITRVGGEGMDIPRQMTGATGYRNADDHFLQLDANEEDMLVNVCNAGFSKVIVVINSCNAMELGFLEENNPYVTKKGYKIDPSKIDAAIWMGYPGDTATYALGEIMNGNVNPSGHTTDTYVTDLKDDPTWNNFGDCNRTSNKTQNGGDQYTMNGTSKLYYFVDYEESIYEGYRYYETRGASDSDWYQKSVVYPFGYGLSYTTFKWELEDVSFIKDVAIEQGKTYQLKVKVTNTGEYAGKDVVEVYGHAPYSAGEIEKSEEVLVAFGKTKELQPKESESLTLEVDPYYLASYDYSDADKDGFQGYELEEGSYSLYVSHNAHDKEFTVPFRVTDMIQYDKSTVNDDVTVENLYTDCEDENFNSDTQLSTLLSRNNWEGTWPTAPNAETDWEQNKSFFEALDDEETNNPHAEEYEDLDYPTTDADNGMKLRDLLFNEDGSIHDINGDGIPEVDYDDPRWDTLLDQLKVSEAINMYDTAAYCTAAVQSIGLPYTLEGDGPVGFTCFMNQTDFKKNTNYAAEMVAGSTWNVDLMEEYGEMIGEEGIIGSEATKLPYSGIYAPGANIHRSAFGGRNAEYMSEDPFLTGKMAAAEIKGMQSKGVVPFIKHFALNEQETHRSISGDCSWVTEQAMREIYLKGFEIAIKESKCHGVMSSFNRIGTRWTGGDYRLMTTILRDEWGFKGCTICDFNTIPQYMISRQMAYAGGDINLTTSATSVSWCDDTSAADVYVLRQNVKNVAYAFVNSNAMNAEIIGYDTPYWVYGLIGLDVLGGIAIAVTGFFTIYHYVRKKD